MGKATKKSTLPGGIAESRNSQRDGKVLKKDLLKKKAWDAKKKDSTDKKTTQTLERSMKEEEQKRKEDAREKRKQKEEKRKENELKSGGKPVQIKNTDKIKKWKKAAQKQLVKMSPEMIERLYGGKKK
eukprot:GHVU01010623.1.p1 GENE.GHVU01010623.1~~GHVU01010623.1.p1  ORF type:complete len:128 (-),score=41.13 GHVU01010623.1:1142-1525(-)